MTTPIRVCIVEDHETVRQGLRLLLESQPDIEIVCEAESGTAALQRVGELGPDVMLLDISMPGMNGLAVTQLVKASHPAVAVVVLTRHSDPAHVQQLLAAGASGYVLKQSPSSELLLAVRSAARGERYLDQMLATRAADVYLGRRMRSELSPPIATEREESVLRLMARGHSNKEIAAELGISVKTVEVHKANGMRKLGLKGRVDVVRYAVLNNWLEDA